MDGILRIHRSTIRLPRVPHARHRIQRNREILSRLDRSCDTTLTPPPVQASRRDSSILRFPPPEGPGPGLAIETIGARRGWRGAQAEHGEGGGRQGLPGLRDARRRLHLDLRSHLLASIGLRRRHAEEQRCAISNGGAEGEERSASDRFDRAPGKGGKNRRRGKNDNEEKRELVFKEDGQGELSTGSHAFARVETLEEMLTVRIRALRSFVFPLLSFEPSIQRRIRAGAPDARERTAHGTVRRWRATVVSHPWKDEKEGLGQHGTSCEVHASKGSPWGRCASLPCSIFPTVEEDRC